jgi:hypothetical protein
MGFESLFFMVFLEFREDSSRRPSQAGQKDKSSTGARLANIPTLAALGATGSAAGHLSDRFSSKHWQLSTYSRS